MKTKREKIIEKAIEILKSNPNGVRYSDLVRKIHGNFPEIPINTIHGTVWNLDRRKPEEIYKAGRGLFRHVKFKEENISEKRETHQKSIKEEDFYEAFANWLVNGIKEYTKAIPFLK
jgi:predicted RNase H-like nuclease